MREKQKLECEMAEMLEIIEKAREIYANDITDHTENEYIREGLLDAGYRKQEWISVDERLPDRSGKYLVATFDGRIGIGNLIDYYCDGELSFDSYKVTHWMPLPEAPEMKGGAE